MLWMLALLINLPLPPLGGCEFDFDLILTTTIVNDTGISHQSCAIVIVTKKRGDRGIGGGFATTLGYGNKQT